MTEADSLPSETLFLPWVYFPATISMPISEWLWWAEGIYFTKFLAEIKGLDHYFPPILHFLAPPPLQVCFLECAHQISHMVPYASQRWGHVP